MPSGSVIVLNGTTSSGKTTLARTLQSQLASAGECWIIIALDDFFSKLPFDWVQLGKHVGVHAEQGIVFEMVDGEIERRLGPLGEHVIAAYRGAVGSAARAGLNVIVDEVLLSEEDWDEWEVELRGRRQRHPHREAAVRAAPAPAGRLDEEPMRSVRVEPSPASASWPRREQ